MKQTSLLDSFVIRQVSKNSNNDTNDSTNKKQSLQNNNNENIVNINQSNQNQILSSKNKQAMITDKKQTSNKTIQNNINIKKSKMSLDSDDQEQFKNLKLNSQENSLQFNNNNKINYQNFAKPKRISLKADIQSQQLDIKNKKNKNSKKKSNKKNKMEYQDQDDQYQAQQEEDQDQFDNYEYNNKSSYIQSENCQQRPRKNRKSAMNNNTANNKNKNKEKTATKQYNDQDELAQFIDKTPQWALPQNHLDKNKLKQGQPGYDPTSLYIPPQQMKNFTATMKQFWKIKSQNYDKIVLFKLGKFYQLFYQDAYKAVKLLNLKWMGKKMHSGFPQKSLQKYAIQLARAGQKIVVVEQMQTPQQMKQRLKKSAAKHQKQQKTIQRQVIQVITKGTSTFAQQDDDSFLSNYLISVRNGFYKDKKVYAYSLLEIGTNTIFYGYEETFQDFKTLLYQTRPVQLLYQYDNISNQLFKMMTQNYLQMVKSQLPDKNSVWHPLSALNTLKYLQEQKVLNFQKTFSKLQALEHDLKIIIYASLSGVFGYLKQLKKFQYVMSAVKFRMTSRNQLANHMILDSQALQHLQVFQTDIGQQGSLFYTIDKTSTKFSKRLLRRWVTLPLKNQWHINQRLDAIQDLKNCPVERSNFIKQVKKLPDIQRTINRLYHYAVKTFANKAVFFQDISSLKLKQFKKLQQYLQIAWDAICILRKQGNSFKSKRLLQLLTVKNYSQQQLQLFQDSQIFYEDQQKMNGQNCQIRGLLPDITIYLKQFRTYIKWDQDGNPQPQKGLAKQYDDLKQQQEQIYAQTKKYLFQWQKNLNQTRLTYTNTKQKFQIEIPQTSEKRRPKDWIFSSRRKGFSRYVNKDTRQFAKRLELIQQKLKQNLGLFVGFFFEQFKKKQKIWQNFISVLAQIDCLVGLSLYASSMVSSCRPVFTKQPEFQIQKGLHPYLSKNISFIANNISLSKDKIMLLTGPNMGGKSTLLRTTCLLTILAQIGCYVPAQSYKCQLVDRIFTRIGASDQLLQGKSTFFIQMQQTNTILKHATKNSLAIMDELGRGTSTFDGMAIAYSVLKSISQKIRCFCLFATHYHTIVQQFMSRQDLMSKGQIKKICKDQSTVSFMMMDSIVMQNGKIIFTYELKQGKVDKSFGINVARSVGIEQQILNIAEKKANQMHQQIMEKRQQAFWNIMQEMNLLG